MSATYDDDLELRRGQLFTDAVHDGLVARNPCSRRTSPGMGKQRPYVATTRQIWALYDAVTEGVRPAILLGARAGLMLDAGGALTVAVIVGDPADVHVAAVLDELVEEAVILDAATFLRSPVTISAESLEVAGLKIAPGPAWLRRLAPAGWAAAMNASGVEGASPFRAKENGPRSCVSAGQGPFPGYDVDQMS